MHTSAVGRTRKERVKQVLERDESIYDFASYIPVYNAVRKLQAWRQQGAEVVYLSSHTNVDDVETDKTIQKNHDFPNGQVFFRHPGEQYNDVVERVLPVILLEDNCESIGGE